MLNLITQGQQFALIKLCSVYTNRRDARLWILSKLTGREIKSSSELTLEEWRKIRDDAYPAWGSNDWTISEKFATKMAGLINEYEEKVLGQMKLF